MKENIFEFPECYIETTPTDAIPVYLAKPNNLEDLEKMATPDDLSHFKLKGFQAKPGEAVTIIENGKMARVYIGVDDEVSIRDGAQCFNFLKSHVGKEILKSTPFIIDGKFLGDTDLFPFTLGWGMASCAYNKQKERPELPKLLIPESLDHHLKAQFEGIYIARTLVNLPANLCGPHELREYARDMADKFSAELTIIDDKELEDGFPLIHTVGNSSNRKPCLIDLRWGNHDHKTVTLIGKGIVFDTGGLDLKPTRAIRLMKKDMGGAAQVIGLAWAIMQAQIPVRLRVLIAVAENSVSDRAMRPGDVYKSRIGHTVEIGNTDAEGRLALADALSYATEDGSPDLLVDFATLTGASTATLGTQISAMFANLDHTARDLQTASFNVVDPMCRIPLWQDYNKEIESPFADLSNDGGPILAALFLKKFLHGNPDWVHLDIHAWEERGRPENPKGGSDQGLRALFTYIRERAS